MKKLFVALAALALSATASAQEARRTVGLGVAITPLEWAGQAPTIEVYLPINLTPVLRIEPSLGLFVRDRPGDATDTRDFTMGVGLFYVQRMAAASDLYFGGRLKLNFASTDNPSNNGTDVLLAAAVGGEHYLAPQFSLGAEAQLGFRDNSDVSDDESGLFTTGLAFVRFYF